MIRHTCAAPVEIPTIRLPQEGVGRNYAGPGTFASVSFGPFGREVYLSIAGEVDDAARSETKVWVDIRYESASPSIGEQAQPDHVKLYLPSGIYHFVAPRPIEVIIVGNQFVHTYVTAGAWAPPCSP